MVLNAVISTLHLSGYASQRPRGGFCGKGDFVKEGRGDEGECESERALGVRLRRGKSSPRRLLLCQADRSVAMRSPYAGVAPDLTLWIMIPYNTLCLSLRVTRPGQLRPARAPWRRRPVLDALRASWGTLDQDLIRSNAQRVPGRRPRPCTFSAFACTLRRWMEAREEEAFTKNLLARVLLRSVCIRTRVCVCVYWFDMVFGHNMGA